MITRVSIPKFDANMVEVTVGAWLIREGATVRKNDPLVELITDKAAFEFEAPVSGVLRKILAREKSIVPVGYILGLIGGSDDVLPDVDRFNQKLLARSRKAAGVPEKETGKTADAPTGERAVVRATPAARRLAREKGIDLHNLKQTMSGEVITEEMVLAWLKSAR